MAMKATEIFSRVSTVLQDTDHRRWPLPELVDWLNDGLREITLRAPQAVGVHMVLDMAAGTRQTLPDNVSSIIGVECNVSVDNDIITRGAAVRPIRKDLMDAQIPNWQNTTILPASHIVAHLIDDEDDQATYLVAPANDGNGAIEAHVAKRPDELSTPNASPNELTSYNNLDVDLDPIYRSALCDFILARAYVKDTNLVGGRTVAQAHYAQFAQALGIKVEVEKLINPYRRPRVQDEVQQ